MVFGKVSIIMQIRFECLCNKKWSRNFSQLYSNLFPFSFAVKLQNRLSFDIFFCRKIFGWNMKIVSRLSKMWFFLFYLSYAWLFCQNFHPKHWWKMQIIVSFFVCWKNAESTVIWYFLLPKDFWLKYENCISAAQDVILYILLILCMTLPSKIFTLNIDEKCRWLCHFLSVVKMHN
jgi:hypothetical protein